MIGLFLGRHLCLKLTERQISSPSRTAQRYSVVFPAALAFFHLARAAAASFALVAGLLRRSFFLADVGADGPAPLILAHRALAAAAIFARAAALNLRRFLAAFGAVDAPLIGGGFPCILRIDQSE
jgi:hypothetical protein